MWMKSARESKNNSREEVYIRKLLDLLDKSGKFQGFEVNCSDFAWHWIKLDIKWEWLSRLSWELISFINRAGNVSLQKIPSDTWNEWSHLCFLLSFWWINPVKPSPSLEPLNHVIWGSREQLLATSSVTMSEQVTIAPDVDLDNKLIFHLQRRNLWNPNIENILSTIEPEIDREIVKAFINWLKVAIKNFVWVSAKAIAEWVFIWVRFYWNHFEFDIYFYPKINNEEFKPQELLKVLEKKIWKRNLVWVSKRSDFSINQAPYDSENVALTLSLNYQRDKYQVIRQKQLDEKKRAEKLQHANLVEEVKKGVIDILNSLKCEDPSQYDLEGFEMPIGMQVAREWDDQELSELERAREQIKFNYINVWRSFVNQWFWWRIWTLASQWSEVNWWNWVKLHERQWWVTILPEWALQWNASVIINKVKFLGCDKNQEEWISFIISQIRKIKWWIKLESFFFEISIKDWEIDLMFYGTPKNKKGGEIINFPWIAWKIVLDANMQFWINVNFNILLWTIVE